MPFHSGASIIVQNLNNETYNGLRGIVQSELDATSLRHNIFLIQSKKTIALKPVNLKHAVPTQNDDVLFMSIKELKSELQSYNISTDSYKDKDSLIEGVRNARDEGWRRPTEVSAGKVPTASNDTDTKELERIINPFSIFKKVFYDDSQNDYSKHDVAQYKDHYVKVIVVIQPIPLE